MQADLAQREGTNTEELKRSLAQIGRSSMRATHTVNQLLALARAESAVPAMHGCNLVHIVTDVVQDCLPRAMDKRIDLGYEGASASTPGVWLNGNATLLAELVRNLVDNAINYTPSSSETPGMVTVRVQADHFGQVLLLQVEDSGPGVPQAERELIFQPFTARWVRKPMARVWACPSSWKSRASMARAAAGCQTRPALARRLVHRALQGHAGTGVGHNPNHAPVWCCAGH